MYKVSVQVPTRDTKDWDRVTSVLLSMRPTPDGSGTNLETMVRDASYFVKTEGKAILLAEQLADSLKAIGHNDFAISHEKYVPLT